MAINERPPPRRKARVNPWGDALDPELKRLHARGLTDAQITKTLRSQGADVLAVHVGKARRRLGLAPNQRSATIAAQPASTLPKARPDPLTFARDILKGRLTERAGSFWLDGSPARLDDVMRAANREAIAGGKEPILASEQWRP